MIVIHIRMCVFLVVLVSARVSSGSRSEVAWVGSASTRSSASRCSGAAHSHTHTERPMLLGHFWLKVSQKQAAQSAASPEKFEQSEN